MRPATVVTVISLCLAPLYNWLLIYKAGLGLYGAAYAMDAMQAGSSQQPATQNMIRSAALALRHATAACLRLP